MCPQLLSKPKFSGVEKIKTIGSTYMAATGLNVTPGPECAQACFYSLSVHVHTLILWPCHVTQWVDALCLMLPPHQIQSDTSGYGVKASTASFNMSSRLIIEEQAKNWSLFLHAYHISQGQNCFGTLSSYSINLSFFTHDHKMGSSLSIKVFIAIERRVGCSLNVPHISVSDSLLHSFEYISAVSGSKWDHYSEM